MATLDSVPAIPSQGSRRKTLAGPHWVIGLIGFWAIFLPMFVTSGYAAIFFATNHHRILAEFIFFWGAVGETFLWFVILYWATKKYVGSRSKDDSSE